MKQKVRSHKLKLQKTDYTCGPAVVVNVLKCFGVDISEDDVLKFTNTTRSKGTPETDLIAAIEGFGYEADPMLLKNFKIAYQYLMRGASVPAILSVDKDAHYVNFLGINDDGNIMIFDPWMKKTGGMIVVTEKEFQKMWRSNVGYYVISVRRS